MSTGLQFGIYPLSVAGTPTGLAVGPPDDYDQIQRVLADIGGDRVLPRTYLIDMGPGSEASMFALADRLRDGGLLGHLTLGTLQEGDLDIDRWVDLVRAVMADYGAQLASLQITNEPNLTFMEGSKPYILDALIHGVIAAKRTARELRLKTAVGFGSVPQSAVTLPHFWTDLASTGGPALADAVDFVGHNFYVDVFEEPLDLAEIPGRVEQTLAELRRRHLPVAGIPASTPIRVTENGWPTGRNPLADTERTYSHQAEVLETVIRTIHRLRVELNISHYLLFGLRDADSAKHDPFHQFGILRDDYSPKPAYETYKTLVGELGPGADSDR